MTDLPFQADDTTLKPELNISTYLNISNQPAGNYYFNIENNFNYTKNWFNYNNFYALDNKLIKEVVQYSKPEIVPNTLDNSKVYGVPSTSMTALWGTRIETSLNTTTPGYSGTDSFGNTYVVGNYIDLNSANGYNSNNTLAFTLTNNGAGSSSICLSKFNSTGVYVWSVRISTQVAGQVVTATYMVTDNNGVTYILGEGTGVVNFRDAAGSTVYSVNVTNKTFLVAYTTAGSPKWITYFTKGFQGFLCVDNQINGNIYVVNNSKYYNNPTIFYDNVLATPVPVLAIGQTITYGTSNIVSVARSAGGVTTVTLSSNASNFGLITGMYVALLGITNDGNSFNTTDPVQITVSGTTFTYNNATGTMPYVTANITGYPVLTMATSSSGYIIGKFRSSSGLFQWATCIDGYRVFNWLNFINFSSQSMATDPSGNLILTGYYTQISSVKNAATASQPIPTDSNISLPPYTNPVVWVPYESDRAWSAIDIDSSGNIIIASVRGGRIYITLDSGASWAERASIQNWSSVYCDSTGQIMLATVSGSIIYRSNNFGVTWSVAEGEALNARNWTALAGNASSSQLVASVQNDSLFYSTNNGIFWNKSNAPNANWIDVSYDANSNSFMALIKNGKAYRSTDGGATWALLAAAPALNWSAISGSRDPVNIGYAFFATVENGPIYGVNSAGTVWTIVDNTNKNYTDICKSGGNQELVYSTVYDGAIYQATTISLQNIWIPTTIPRLWNKIATSYSSGGALATIVATVNGGQIYIAKNTYPTIHTFLVKYNTDGIAQWSNYINTEEIYEESNQGVSITSQSNGDIILYGKAASDIYFFSPSDFTNPIKSLTNVASYLASYSTNGLPLWVNSIAVSTTSAITSMCTDIQDNIYCVGYADNVILYNPNGQSVFTSTSTLSGIVIKYYPNGFVQSFTRISTPSGTIYGTSITVVGQTKNIYLSGWKNAAPSAVNYYNSPGNVLGLSTNFTAPGIFFGRYNTSDTPSINFPTIPYNSVFDTLFSIGGSTKELVSGYISDGTVEIWGGKTGLPPSVIDVDDVNAGVISYLGHLPGYTIPTENGIQTENPIQYNYLSVFLSEPSFPINDPQPVTPGTIPYGYLPIYMTFPSYATGVVFNNSLNNDTDLVLYAVGTISASNLYVQGITAGDTIRILVHASEVVKYVTLHVKGFILSDTNSNTQAGLVFEESTRNMTNILEGTIVNGTTTFITINSTNYVPTFYAPKLLQSGNLNLILQAYPKFNV